MRLLSCHIENFGVLHDFDMDFSDGINTVVRENGWGKSTLSAFVKVMLYGFDGESKKSAKDKERIRFKPWQGGVYGGSIIFQTAGREYVLTRIFSDKASNDTFELRDANTNLISNDFDVNLGEVIFKMDRESFERTAFIGQNSCETAPTDDIAAGLTKLTEDTNDINNFEAAIARLESAYNRLTPNRKTGSVSKREQQIAELERKIRLTSDLEEGLYEQERELEKLIENLAELKERKREAEAIVKSQSELFCGNVPSLEDIREKLGKCRNLAKAEERMRLLELSEEEAAELAELKEKADSDAEADSEKKQEPGKCAEHKGILEAYVPKDSKWEKDYDVSVGLDDRRRQSEDEKKIAAEIDAETKKYMAANDLIFNYKPGRWAKRIGIILCALGLFGFALVSLALAGDSSALWRRLLLTVYNPALDVVFAGAAIAGIIIVVNSIRSEKIKMDFLVTEARRLKAGLQELEDKFALARQARIDREKYEAELRRAAQERLAQLLKKEADFEEACENYDRAAAEIVAYLHGLGLEPEDNPERQLKGIEEQVDDYYDALDRLDMIREEGSIEAIRQKRNYIDGLRERIESREEDAGRLEDLKAKQTEEKRTSELILSAARKLQEAKVKMTAKYAEPLRRSFAHYYELIAHCAADSFRVDAHAELSLESHGTQHGIGALSAGLRDLTGLCMRMALVDAVYPEEKPMLIMDDPFVNLDDKNLEGALSFLQTISERYQVIYFSCSRTRM